MRAMRILTVCIAVGVMMPGYAFGQPNDCEWLLRYGIYDTTEVSFDQYTVEHFRFLLSKSTAQTYEAFRKDSLKSGLTVPFADLPISINIDGKSAEGNFREWKSAFLQKSSQELLLDQKFRVVTRTISPALMDAVKTCLSNQPKGSVVTWIKPSKDGLTFTLNIKYIRVLNENATIKSITYATTPNANGVKIVEAENNKINAGTKIDFEGDGTTLLFKRDTVATNVTIVIATDRGSKTVELQGADPNEAVKALNMRFVELDQKLKEAEQKISDQQMRRFGGFVENNNDKPVIKYSFGSPGHNVKVQDVLVGNLPNNGEYKLSFARPKCVTPGSLPVVTLTPQSINPGNFRNQTVATVKSVGTDHVIVEMWTILNNGAKLGMQRCDFHFTIDWPE